MRWLSSVVWQCDTINVFTHTGVPKGFESRGMSIENALFIFQKGIFTSHRGDFLGDYFKAHNTCAPLKQKLPF